MANSEGSAALEMAKLGPAERVALGWMQMDVEGSGAGWLRVNEEIQEASLTQLRRNGKPSM